jgi:hypothetical protein
MKRVGGLFERIHDRATLGHAAWRAAAGKRDRKEVSSFLNDGDRHLGDLARTLADGSFRFDGYRSFPIRDPKSRIIRAPSFRDRVVHHAMFAVAGPVIERGALPTSFACRTGLGQDAALRAARRAVAGAEWFLGLDIRKFYDSIPHDLLLRALERRFRERRLIALFQTLLDSYQTVAGRGLPIGALTSQILGNFYLDAVDRQVTGAVPRVAYLRYMDDILIGGDRRSLLDCRKRITATLCGLGLSLNGDGVMNRSVVGAPWLGFVIYPDRLRLNRRGRRRLRRRVRALERGYRQGMIPDTELQSRGLALFAHPRRGDDIAWRRVVAALGCGADSPGEVQGPQPRDPRRGVEQHRREVPVGLPQQEQAR